MENLVYAVWRTWLFMAWLRWKMIILQILTTSIVHFSLKGLENVLFELGSEKVEGEQCTCRGKHIIFISEVLFWGIILRRVLCPLRGKQFHSFHTGSPPRIYHSSPPPTPHNFRWFRVPQCQGAWNANLCTYNCFEYAVMLGPVLNRVNNDSTFSG